MQRFFITLEQTTFSYLKGGSGEKLLICLHGFGEAAASFEFLERHLGETFTIYALDFPWHGQTVWKNKLTFPVKEMIQVMERIIDNFKENKIHLLCYSMGGRVGLSLLQRLPHKIEKAVFLAPDGLKVNFWYWLATQTWAGNGLFRITMQNPKWFAWMVDVLQRSGWINRSVAKFVHTYIDDRKMRDDLYRIWTTMRKFRPQLGQVKMNIKEHNIPVHFVFGEYDRVILAENGFRFQNGLEALVGVEVIKSGHQLLKEKHADVIKRLLSSENKPFL